MSILLGVLVSVAVIFAVFAVTLGRGGSMTQFQPDWPGRPLPEERTVRAADVSAAKFSLAFRGYRMAEVDDALDRLAAEIAERDDAILRLSGRPFESQRTAIESATVSAPESAAAVLAPPSDVPLSDDTAPLGLSPIPPTTAGPATLLPPTADGGASVDDTAQLYMRPPADSQLPYPPPAYPPTSSPAADERPMYDGPDQ